MTSVLDVAGLTTRFQTPDGEVRAVSDVSFSVAEGESLGIVGESGSGKTQIFMSVMGLLAKNGEATGSVRFRGRDILNLPSAQLNDVRGVKMAMIFQDPMTSLNPYLTVRRQMTEVLEEHRGMAARAATARAVELLERVGIPEAKRRITMYPHEFSGGMRQRVMIAMALLCEPDLVIADEPTTALDVTVQAQILDLLKGLQRDLNMAIALVTHDLGVIAGLCDRVMVMYAGKIVETAPIDDIFASPSHPYTKGLLNSMPRLDEAKAEELSTIPGQPPNLQAIAQGCPFRPRCAYAIDRCGHEEPALQTIADARAKACHVEIAV